MCGWITTVITVVFVIIFQQCFEHVDQHIFYSNENKHKYVTIVYNFTHYSSRKAFKISAIMLSDIRNIGVIYA